MKKKTRQDHQQLHQMVSSSPARIPGDLGGLVGELGVFFLAAKKSGGGCRLVTSGRGWSVLYSTARRASPLSLAVALLLVPECFTGDRRHRDINKATGEKNIKVDDIKNSWSEIIGQ